jgi:putative ABC transport system ATP-binding protein
MAVIKLENVSKLYGFGDATILALDEVNLSIEKGEFIAVMGPSGCGKSTLMNVIGLLDKPSLGTFKLEGKAITKLRSSKAAKIRRDTIGFVFQSYNLLPRLNVLDNVALPLSYKGIAQAKRLNLASQMLERVGIQNREYYLPGQLSGGQIQCAAIARALINSPKIIIADEPTGNLDSANSRMVMDLLADIHHLGNTVIFVTHNPDLTRYATRVLFMHDGSIVHDEKNVIGKVAQRVNRVLFTLPTKEDGNVETETKQSSKPPTKKTVNKKVLKATPRKTKKASKGKS